MNKITPHIQRVNLQNLLFVKTDTVMVFGETVLYSSSEPDNIKGFEPNTVESL